MFVILSHIQSSAYILFVILSHIQSHIVTSCTHRAASLGLPALSTGLVIFPEELGPAQERLGSGAQGEVYLALLRGSQVAVKVFQGLGDRRNGMVMLHEIEMNLRAGRHPNVVQCKGLCSKSEHELLLIMEYCPRYFVGVAMDEWDCLPLMCI